MYWTQNQAHMTLVRTGPGVLRVLLETDMPNFARYEWSVDGGPWTQVDGQFQYNPKPGANELRVRAVNSMGLPGIVSRATVAYSP